MIIKDLNRGTLISAKRIFCIFSMQPAPPTKILVKFLSERIFKSSSKNINVLDEQLLRVL